MTAARDIEHGFVEMAKIARKAIEDCEAVRVRLSAELAQAKKARDGFERDAIAALAEVKRLNALLKAEHDPYLSHASTEPPPASHEADATTGERVCMPWESGTANDVETKGDAAE